MLTYAVFGGTSCEAGTEGKCEACRIDASGMQLTFLLNQNNYSQETAEAWEAKVYIRNWKSFNKALDNGYHTDLDGPTEGLDYNQDLIANIQKVLKDNPDMIKVKGDCLAERSIEDNIVLETQQNSSVAVISYILMFFYLSIAIGYFPSAMHMKFGLGLAGIGVVIGALLVSIGITFYWN